MGPQSTIARVLPSQRSWTGLPSRVHVVQVALAQAPQSRRPHCNPGALADPVTQRTALLSEFHTDFSVVQDLHSPQIGRYFDSALRSAASHILNPVPAARSYCLN